MNELAQHKLEINADNSVLSGEFSFKQTSKIFAGHFPGKPILAGAFQVYIIKYLIEKMLNETLIVRKIEKAKFTDFIEPEQIFKISVSLSKKDVEYGVKATISKAEKKASKYSLLLAKYSAV